MDRVPLKSDRFKTIAYDIPNHLLEVVYADGSVRQYKKIEQEVYERLLHATRELFRREDCRAVRGGSRVEPCVC